MEFLYLITTQYTTKMKYDKLKEFMKRTGKSKSKIGRFYKLYPDLHSETTMKGKWRVYPIEHARYFDSEMMFDENKALRLENQSMKNLIKCLTEKNSLQYRLWEMDWSFFGTVAYKNDRNQKSCYRQMSGLYDSLIDKYGNDTALNLFFTTEPFANRDGYHNHFVIFVEDTALHQKVINDIEAYFSYDRVDIKQYDKLRAGLWYMSKDGLSDEDYDLLGNNLGGKIRKTA